MQNWWNWHLFLYFIILYMIRSVSLVGRQVYTFLKGNSWLMNYFSHFSISTLFYDKWLTYVDCPFFYVKWMKRWWSGVGGVLMECWCSHLVEDSLYKMSNLSIYLMRISGTSVRLVVYSRDTTGFLREELDGPS